MVSIVSRDCTGYPAVIVTGKGAGNHQNTRVRTTFSREPPRKLDEIVAVPGNEQTAFPCCKFEL